MPKRLGSRGLRLLDRAREFFQYVEEDPKYEPVEVDKLITMVFELGGYYGVGTRYNVRDWGDFTRAAAGGAGYTNTLQVPKGERVVITGLAITRTGGDGTLIEALARNRTNSLECRIMNQSAAASLYVRPVDLGFPLILDQDMGIRCYVDALTSDSTWQLAWMGGSLPMRVD